MIDMQTMRNELFRDEDRRLFVYDDATGKPIAPGTLVKGHPTIGVGRALDTHGISREESAYLLNNDIESCIAALSSRLTWWEQLDDVRQRVLVNMAFNMGVSGLMSFKKTLAAIGAHNWTEAAAEILDSDAARQLPVRYERLAEMMRTGRA